MADRTVSVELQAKVAGFISGMNSASKSAGDFSNKLTDGAARNSESWNQVANTALGFGAALVGAAGLAIAKFAEFDQAMSQVQAATHASASEMSSLRDAALDAGAKTAFSATEAANAIENLAKAGISTSDTLGGALDGALSLAAAGELDVADAAEIAATAMTQFNLKGSEVPHIADLLAAGAGKAQGEVTDLAAALKQGGLVAGQAGLSIEETTGTLAAFASAGLLGSDAGTSLKTMLLRLMNPSAEAADVMQELGINAYDASGNFVSMANLSGQLKEKLAGMSQAQRDAALATIFGSDAIRAASVLYQEGQSGIQGWINKVDDSGYAAETAALKMDNLKGDLELLGGSIETALIEAGSGANSALREIVQGLDGLVAAFTELPDAAQSVVLMGTLAAGGALLLVGGAMKAVSAISELKTALIALGISGRTAMLGLGGIGLLLTAGAVALSVFASSSADAKQMTDELTRTLDQQSGALTENSREWAFNQAKQDGLIDAAERLGIPLDVVIDALLGEKDAIREVNSAIDEHTGKTGKWGQENLAAAQGMDGASKAARALTDGIDGTNKALARGREEIRQRKEAHANATGTEQEATKAAQANAQAMAENASETSAAADALQEMDDRASGLIDTLELLSATFDQRGALSAYEQALDDARKMLKDVGGATSGAADAQKRWKDLLAQSNQPARDFEDVLRNIWDTSGKVAEHALRLEGNQKKANAALQDGRAQLVDMAAKYLGSRKKAEEYVTTVLGIPKDVSTDILQPGMEKARGDARGLRKEMLDVPSLIKAEVESGSIVTASSRAATLVSKLLAIEGTYTATVSIYESVTRVLSGPKKRATGGPVNAKEPYLVGEKGPELVTFDQSGYVHNATATKHMMADAVTKRTPQSIRSASAQAQPQQVIHEGNVTIQPLRVDVNERNVNQVIRAGRLQARVGREI